MSTTQAGTVSLRSTPCSKVLYLHFFLEIFSTFCFSPGVPGQQPVQGPPAHLTGEEVSIIIKLMTIIILSPEYDGGVAGNWEILVARPAPCPAPGVTTVVMVRLILKCVGPGPVLQQGLQTKNYQFQISGKAFNILHKEPDGFQLPGQTSNILYVAFVIKNYQVIITNL